jgi:hypothetical protein
MGTSPYLDSIRIVHARAMSAKRPEQVRVPLI